MMIKINRIQFLFLLTAWVFWPFLSSAQSSAAQRIREKIRVHFDSLQKANGFPGLTFAAILPGKERISLAVGLADSAGMKKMEAHHRMLAGSIGKTFFAVPALLLVQRGVFSLDDPIEKYIGRESWFERIPNAHAITIRMLMNHTSGIEEYYELGDFMQRLKNDPLHVYAPVELLSYVMDRKPLFAAGTDWGYADTNFLLLGYIIEKITGKKMYDLSQQMVIGPMKLKDTEPSVHLKYRLLANGHSSDRSPFPYHGALFRHDSLPFNPQFEWTGGGFISSSTDLAEWARQLYFFPALQPVLRTEMQKGIPAKTGREHKYGLGLQIRPGGRFGYGYGHSGWFPGYLSDSEYFPQTDVSLAIQFNTDDLRQLKRSTHVYLLDALAIIDEELKAATR